MSIIITLLSDCWWGDVENIRALNIL